MTLPNNDKPVVSLFGQNHSWTFYRVDMPDTGKAYRAARYRQNAALYLTTFDTHRAINAPRLEERIGAAILAFEAEHAGCHQVAEARAPYTVEDTVAINRALAILTLRMRAPGQAITTPEVAKDFLRLAMHGLEAERFDVLFMDVKNRLLAHRVMFAGTLTQTSVYPREVVKAALATNACAVILAHNHPSGVPEPSDADLHLTNALVQALGLVSVRVLDHFIVAGAQVHSMAENGQL